MNRENMHNPKIQTPKSVNKILSSALIGVGITSLFLTGCATNQPLSTNTPQVSKKSPFHSTVNQAQTLHKTDVTPDRLNIKLATQTHYTNVWDEMRFKFDLADEHYGKYDDFLSFYNNRKTHLERVSERAKPYLYYILNEVKKRNMPYEMALLPVVESGFRPTARSHQRAVGLWQFIPGTAELYDLDRNWWYDGRKDVIESTTAALDYLEKLYKHNNNDWLLALASYNAGLGNVYKAQRKYRKAHKQRPGIEEYQPNFWEIQSYLPKETQGYVPKLLSVAHIVEYSDRFQVQLEPIDNQPFFSIFTLDKQVSLNQVAKVSDTPMNLLASLNPGYHQPATPPSGPYHLLLPADRAVKFQHTLQTDNSLFNIQWQRHKIKAGDSLSVIAEKYKTSSIAIKKLNGMKNANIRAGKTLLIPIPLNQTTLVMAKNDTSNGKTASPTVKKPHPHLTQTKTTLASNRQTHTVRPGDSLWKLAKAYNTSSKQIAQWNNLSLKSTLRQGQKLAIYGQPAKNSSQKIEHTLKTGENLWLLAKRYKVLTTEIAKWNGISTKQILKPGQKLIIWSKNSAPVTTKYIVKNGDNLWNIAKANQVSATHLAKFNRLSLKTLLQPGQILHIPDSEQEIQES